MKTIHKPSFFSLLILFLPPYFSCLLQHATFLFEYPNRLLPSIKYQTSQITSNGGTSQPSNGDADFSENPSHDSCVLTPEEKFRMEFNKSLVLAKRISKFVLKKVANKGSDVDENGT
ncbi:TIMELESS-interacting protein [Bienertia sinuspersici]